MERETWEELGSREQPSWYLHPLVAEQKRLANLSLVRRWASLQPPHRVLKTDLFEEAFGNDHILPGLYGNGTLVCGIDTAHATVAAAAERHPALARGFIVMDVRRPAMAEGSLDLIISTSTLDHFATRAEFLESLHSLAGLLRPGGCMVLTLDNPWNPLFHPLRWLAQRRGAPFPIGYTPSLPALRRDLEQAGLRVEDHDWIIHNPRLISTLTFVALRKAFGRHGNGAVRFLLWVFSLFGRLPTRPFTACFHAVKAVRLPDVNPRRS